MDDDELLRQIGELVEEEHRLREHKPGEALDEGRLARLSELEVRLDRFWDLLRRRRAREEYGDSPDAEQLRPADVVEHYKN